MLGHAPISGAAIADIPVWRVRLTGTATVDAWRRRMGPVALRGEAVLEASMDNRVYAATTDYITRPADRISNRLFLGTVRRALRFQRSIVDGNSFLGYTSGLGEMELNNAEADYDYLIREYAIDGRRIKVKLGDAEGPYDAFGTIFDGTATGWHVDEESLIIELRDFGYQLETPVSPNTYSGEGGVNGSEDVEGKRKPRLFGHCFNVTPVFLDPQTLLYQANDGPVQEIEAVYSRGAELSRGTDHATVDALMAAEVEPGFFDTCHAADGLFRIAFANDAERGAITCDVKGDKAGGVYFDTPTEIIRRLAVETAGIDRIDETSFDYVAARQSSEIGVYLSADDETDVASVCRDIMTAIGGWCGFRRNGTMEVGILEDPDGVDPLARYDRVEIIEIERDRMPDSVDPPPWRRRIGYARNWTVQENDLAGVVTEERRAFLKEEYRVAESKDARIKTNHPRAQDPDIPFVAFAKEADAAAESDRVLTLFRRSRSIYSLQLKTQPFLLNLGDVIRVTFPRWDLGEGKLLRVVSLDEDSEDSIVEVGAFG